MPEWLREAMCGAIAGLTADIACHPFDTMRCRSQVRVGVKESIVQSFRQAIAAEGVGVLYRGFGVVALGTIPAHALYFGGYEWSKRTLTDRVFDSASPWQTSLLHFTSGLAAELCGALVWTPMDVVKQRTMIRDSASGCVDYQNSWRGIRTVWLNEGLRGFYRGFGTGVAVYGPFVGIYFTCYEQMKLRLAAMRSCQPSELSTPYHLASGFMSGTIAAAATCPLDVVKTRLQVTSKQQQPLPPWAIARNLLREEGPRAFWKGLEHRVLWIAPSMAITIAVYEFLKGFV